LQVSEAALRDALQNARDYVSAIAMRTAPDAQEWATKALRHIDRAIAEIALQAMADDAQAMGLYDPPA
jgi:hypothetical protein